MERRWIAFVSMLGMVGFCVKFMSVGTASQSVGADAPRSFSYTDPVKRFVKQPLPLPQQQETIRQQEEPVETPNPYMPSSPFMPSTNRENFQKTIDSAIESDQNRNPNIKEKLEEREAGRKLQTAGQTIQNVTSMAAKPLMGVTDFAGTVVSAALPPGETKLGITLALGGAQVLIIAAQGLGKSVGAIVTAYGRFKEKSQEIASTNEQIIEAANQSDIKIQKLSKQLESLLNPLTVQKIFGSRNSAGEQLPVSKRLLNLFAPSMYTNTFKEFTDKLYITDNKAKKWEIIKSISEELKKEQKYYDDLIILLQIKILQYSLYELNKLINKDKTIVRLNHDKMVFDKAKEQLDVQIKNTKNNFFNRKKYNQLLEQKIDLNKKIEEADRDLKYYQEHAENGTLLEKYRKEIGDEINKLTNLTNIKNKPDYLKEKDIAQAAQDVKIMQSKITNLEKMIGTIVQRLNRLENQRPMK